MKNILLPSVLLVIAFSAIGQAATEVQKKSTTKVLIIDTIDRPLANFHILIEYPIDTNREYPRKQLTPDINYANFPNLVLPITVEQTNSTIDIPLDDSGGSISIKHAFISNTDTIRIHKISILQNCFADTSKTSKTWFKNYQDTTRHSKTLKSKFRILKITPSQCDAQKEKKIVLVINNTKYIVPLEIRQDRSVVQLGHGWNKRNERRRSAGKSYTYFVVRQWTAKYIYSAELKLK